MQVITVAGDSTSVYNSTVAGADATWVHKLMHLLGETTFTNGFFYPWSGADTQGNALLHQVLTGANWTLYDAAIGGETATQNEARFVQDMLGHTFSDYGIVLIGLNDANGSVAWTTTCAKIMAMVHRWEQVGTQPIICTTTPFSAGSDAQKAIIRVNNAHLRVFAAGNGYRLADTYLAMDPTDTGSAVALQEADGMHPNDAGYTVIADCIHAALVAAAPAVPTVPNIRVAAREPVGDWIAIEEATGYGHWLDSVNGRRAYPMRTGAKTTTRTGKVIDVPANYLAITEAGSGMAGVAGYPEAARTNAFLRSYVADASGLAAWTADSGLTATLRSTAHALYNASQGITLAADGSNRALWQQFTATATTWALSAYVWRDDGAAVSATHCQLCAAAGTTTPVGTLLDTTFTAVTGMKVGTSQVYRATALFTGTAAAWTAGVAVKANQGLNADLLQTEASTYPTSYIPTTTATVTRAADMCPINTIGWDCTTATWMFTAGVAPTPLSTDFMLGGWGTGTGQRVYLEHINTISSMCEQYGSTARTAQTGQLTAWGVLHGSWTSGAKVNAYVDAGTKGQSSVVADPLPPMPMYAFIGGYYDGTLNYDGPIQRATYYDTLLTDDAVLATRNDVMYGPVEIVAEAAALSLDASGNVYASNAQAAATAALDAQGYTEAQAALLASMFDGTGSLALSRLTLENGDASGSAFVLRNTHAANPDAIITLDGDASATGWGVKILSGLIGVGVETDSADGQALYLSGGAAGSDLTLARSRHNLFSIATSALTVAGSLGKHIVDFLTGDIFGRLGTPAGASVSADIADVESKVDDLESRLGVPTTTIAAELATVDGNVDDIETSIDGDIFGTDSCTLTIRTDATVPVVDAQVFISSDAAGTQRSRTKFTNSLGQVRFGLTAGVTYYCWRFSDTTTFASNPVSFVAAEDA